MYQTITESQFIDQMNAIRPGQISYSGLQALFNFYEELEDQSNPQEFDPIAIFCEWTEYETIQELIKSYSYTLDTQGEDEDIEEYHERVLDQLKDHTSVLPIGGIHDSILVMDF